MSAAQWLARARWTLLGLILAFFVLLVAFARTVTDWFWFQALGYPGLFLGPLLWQGGVGAAAALASFLFLLVNLYATRRSVVEAFARFEGRLPGAGAISLRWIRPVLAGGAALVALLSGGAVAQHWHVIAHGVYGGSFGIADPIFGRDVGFYIFTLPALQIALRFASGQILLAALIAGAIYLAAGGVQVDGRRVRLAGRARAHLSILAAAFALAKAGAYTLDAFALLYSQRGAVYGVSYVDAAVVLPGLRVLTALALLLAAAAVVNVVRPALRWIAAALLLLGVASVLVGGVLPAAVQELVVRPNELEKELPYISHHIDMTRRAWGLDRIVEASYESTLDVSPAVLEENPWLAQSIRLWDWRPLLDTYAQVQSLRPYYDFIEVDVDRYQTASGYRQVMLSARELNPARLQNRTWVNEHLQYTHGYGVVVSPVNEASPRGLPTFLVANIPPESQLEELRIERPQIYYGEMQVGYAVVGTRRPEFDYPQGSENVTTFYEGTGGVPLGGFFRRALFAARFGTTRLLLSRDITPQSRIMFRRSITERVQALAPFLRYDRDPYLVIADGRLYWMLDAYTVSERFPYAMPVPGWGSYARNSVKVVVDAYEGSVDFYVAEDEPIVRAWSWIFPGVFKPLADMPPSLRAHLRYPEDLFLVQSLVLTRYHMTSPQVYYNQEDVWELPREIYEQTEIEMQPYYTISRLPGERREEFLLMLPFTPVGKRNLIAWLAARNDGEHYGELRLYTVDKQELTFGPMQFEAQVNQDPEISAQLTLWGQQGSRVIRGNLIILPVSGTFLYVEPLFLQAESSSMPELKRVIVGLGERLVMSESFPQAVAQLVGASAPFAGAGSSPGASPAQPSAQGRPPQPLGATAKELAARAAQLLAEAQRHAGSGSWSEYGQALDALAEVLDRLKEVVAGEEADP